MRTLLVYNTCGLSGHDHSDVYIDHVKTLLAQDFRGAVAVSGCRLLPRTKRSLVTKLPPDVIFNFIADLLPVNVTFNHTVMACERLRGPFDAHVYIDSGVRLESLRPEVPHHRVVATLEALLATGRYAVVTGQVDNDTGHEHLGPWDGRSDYEVPVGRACNAHFNFYHRSLYETFGRPVPDVFAGNCSESVFTFMCAAVRRRWAVSGRVVVPHRRWLDGASAGFGGLHAGWDNLFAGKSMRAILADPEMWGSGMGYEECNRVFLHDPARYAPDGSAIDPERLRRFLAANFYLRPADFDYGGVRSRAVSAPTLL